MSRGYEISNPTVREVDRLNLRGNVIPAIWFKRLQTEAGNPYPLAALILAEIIY